MFEVGLGHKLIWRLPFTEPKNAVSFWELSAPIFAIAV